MNSLNIIPSNLVNSDNQTRVSDQKLPLSSTNKKILSTFMKSIEERLNFNSLEEKSQKGVLSSVWSYISPVLPEAKTVGEFTGQRLALTHGASLSNNTIDYVAGKVFKPQASSGYFTNMYKSSAKAASAEALKFIITPSLVPILGVLGLHVGGMTAVGLVALASNLMSYYADNKEEFSPKDLDRPLEEIFQVDDLGNLKVDGVVLNEDDINGIRKYVMQYQVANQFYEAEPSEVQAIATNYLFMREDTFDYYYQDGTPISDEELEIIDQALNALSRANPACEKRKKIKKMVRLFAQHSAKPEKGLEKGFVKCEDGLYCKRDGSSLMNQKDYEEYAENQEAKRTEENKEIIEEFVMI